MQSSEVIYRQVDRVSQRQSLLLFAFLSFSVVVVSMLPDHLLHRIVFYLICGICCCRIVMVLKIDQVFLQNVASQLFFDEIELSKLRFIDSEICVINLLLFIEFRKRRKRIRPSVLDFFAVYFDQICIAHLRIQQLFLDYRGSESTELRFWYIRIG